MGKADLLREEVVQLGRDGDGGTGEQHVVCFKSESSHGAPGPHLSLLERPTGPSQAPVFTKMVVCGSTGMPFRAQETQDGTEWDRGLPQRAALLWGKLQRNWLTLAPAGASLWECLSEHLGHGHVPTEGGQWQWEGRVFAES